MSVLRDNWVYPYETQYDPVYHAVGDINKWLTLDLAETSVL